MLETCEPVSSDIIFPLNTTDIAAQNSRLDLLICTVPSEFKIKDDASASADSRHRATFSRKEMAYLRTCRSSRDVSSIWTSASATPAASINASAVFAFHLPTCSVAILIAFWRLASLSNMLPLSSEDPISRMRFTNLSSASLSFVSSASYLLSFIAIAASASMLNFCLKVVAAVCTFNACFASIFRYHHAILAFLSGLALQSKVTENFSVFSFEKTLD
mmetsp:Transcript_12910/g.23764  ORF Transcript_12910/g.23764 Transcript_12910/m.23764 type:complete len:218 (+) Transcript_12910:964-1617(+)